MFFVVLGFVPFFFFFLFAWLRERRSCLPLAIYQTQDERRARMHENGSLQQAKWSQKLQSEKQDESKDQGKLCKWKGEQVEGKLWLYCKHFVPALFTQKVKKGLLFCPKALLFSLQVHSWLSKFCSRFIDPKKCSKVCKYKAEEPSITLICFQWK